MRVEDVTQFNEDFDVESRIVQPRIGQWPGGPVGCRVFLREAPIELAFDERSEADPWQVEQATGEFGVEQRFGSHLDLGETHQVLGCGVKDPLGIADRRIELTQVIESDRVDQGRAGVLTTYLNEISPLGIAITRSTLSIERHRSGAGLDGCADALQRSLRLDNRGEGLAKLKSW